MQTLPSAPRIVTPDVQIIKKDKPQNKRDVTLLNAVTANTTGAAVNVGEGYAFSFYLTGAGNANANVVIDSQDGNGNWATWRTYSVPANSTVIHEAVSAQRMIRARVTGYLAGTITVRAIIVNIHAVDNDAPSTIAWSNVTNVPSNVSEASNLDVTVPMIQVGDLATGQLVGYFKPRKACKIVGIDFTVGDAPAGSSTTIDVTKNGVDQAKTVTIAAGTYAGQGIFGTVLEVAAGDVIRVKVTGVGSTAPGANLVANLLAAAA